MLENIWNKIDNCPFCIRSGNHLQHVLGGGQANEPEFALVFINPTYNNISTNPQWHGRRFPFIGTRQIWRILVKSGLLPEETLNITEGKWAEESADELESIMKKNGVYLTNIVKCTASHGDAPSKELVNAQLPLLFQELSAVKPKLIIAMGLLPLKTLTGIALKLGEFTQDFEKAPRSFQSIAGPVVPCWFPVGRGNPRKAVELLTAIKNWK